MNNILLIDDREDFAETISIYFASKGITVIHRKSFDGLKELLPKSQHLLAAVVLDIKCLMTDDQEKEESSFITVALKYLDQKASGFPRFILTGDDVEFETIRNYFVEEKVFLKTPQGIDSLFIELDNCVQNAIPLRLKRENPLIFDAFEDGVLPMDKEYKVLNILENYNESNPANFKGIIGDIREIHEDVYKSINNRNNSVVPDRFISDNGLPSFKTDFYNHLLGNLDRNNKFLPTTTVYQDSTISSTTKFIHSACSEFIHDSSKEGYQISHYTLKSLINSLMEVIIWAKQY